MAEQTHMSVEAALGTIVVLAAASPVHRHTLFVGDVAWWALPPVQAGQFRLFQSQNRPVGAVLWAKVTPEVGERLADGGRVAVQEWQSGDQYWVVDVIAPHGGVQEMLTELANGVLKDTGAQYLTTKADGTKVVNKLDDLAAQAESGASG
jgi:cytolysin-activating lysine-acyltransferase